MKMTNLFCQLHKIICKISEFDCRLSFVLFCFINFVQKQKLKNKMQIRLLSFFEVIAVPKNIQFEIKRTNDRLKQNLIIIKYFQLTRHYYYYYAFLRDFNKNVSLFIIEEELIPYFL